MGMVEFVNQTFSRDVASMLPEIVMRTKALLLDQVLKLIIVEARVEDVLNFPFLLISDDNRSRFRLNMTRNAVGMIWRDKRNMEDWVNSH